MARTAKTGTVPGQTTRQGFESVSCQAAVCEFAET